VYIYRSYRKIKTGVPFFLDHPVCMCVCILSDMLPHLSVTGVVAKEFFEKSKLPVQELSKIWYLFIAVIYCNIYLNKLPMMMTAVMPHVLSLLFLLYYGGMRNISSMCVS